MPWRSKRQAPRAQQQAFLRHENEVTERDGRIRKGSHVRAYEIYRKYLGRFQGHRLAAP